MLVKVLIVNLLLFAIYTASITFGSPVADRGFSIAVGMGICVVIQVVLNAITALAFMIFRNRQYAIAFIISAAVLVPTGLITWLVMLSIFG